MSNQSKTASVWHATTETTRFPQLNRDISVDVAIVGGGITGLTAALLLKRAGRSVAVLEGSEIGSGVTGNTSAHLSEYPDIGYQQLISNFGEDGAKLTAQSRRAAIETIAAFVEDEGIECEFQRVPGYLYTENQTDVSFIEKEIDAAQKLGIAASFTTEVSLPFPIKAAMLLPNQGQFNAMKYLEGLANTLTREGGQIYEQTRVTNINGDGDRPGRVSTDRGTVTANDVIIATHMPIHDVLKLQDLLPLTTKAAPYRSYAIGVRLKNIPTPQGLFWDTVEPYHYTRSYATQDGEILIVGGEDHKTGKEIDTETRYQRLEAYVRERYPVESIDYRWSAQVYEPVDGLPFIGASFLHPHIYAATGFSGNGLTFGTLAALILSDAIVGQKNPWRELYDLNRFNPIASAQEFVSENLGVATHFIGDRFKSEAKTLGEVQPNQGKIMAINGEQLAVYRDENGQIHALSPVCTHTHCIVSWNNAEQSWDCPCHGGRFSATGEVLNGPPIENLKRKQLS